ncbi:hypothetical protein FM042_01290 [Aliidiomarina halalkaliphila]|uniref:Uncharacterized protein n=1 Tax=Aliidiomarina halalkaliphila TaxID=2593535 RepID=A0A552X3D0_9GAMM|nr:hypothetical protein [Aliidiomarina halalkaliphila]TRW49527.1 hypothetical protein FM042_01290 [Aliidiomarina halalkaliphila]
MHMFQPAFKKLRWSLVLLPAFLISACIPVRHSVVIVPQTTGSVWVAETGQPLGNIALQAHLRQDGVYPDTPIYSESAGPFLIPLWEEERTDWRLPTVGGTYREGYFLEARHQDFAPAYMYIAFVHPFERQADGFPLIVYHEHLPLPDAIADCPERAATAHAWTLANDLPRLANEAWFRDVFVRHGAEVNMLDEYFSTALGHFYRSCGISSEEQRQISRTYREGIELLLQNEAYLQNQANENTTTRRRSAGGINELSTIRE